MSSSEELIANNDALLRHFNLSQNKLLRTLEITVESIDAAGDTASDFLKTILSSVTSPGPLDVVIIYQDYDFFYYPPCKRCNLEPLHSHHCFQDVMDKLALDRRRQLRVFREMHSVRDIRLVLCADVSWDSVRGVTKTLEHIVKGEKVEGRTDYFLYKPPIVFERRMLHTRPNDYPVGYSGREPILASAL